MKRDFGIAIEHAGIHVKNMDETMAWYHDIFGFELANDLFERTYLFTGGVFPRCCTMRLGDFELEIYEIQEGLPFNFVDFEWTEGMKHLSFKIRDIEEWIQYIKEKNVDIVVENYYGPNGITVYLRDNNGILVEATDVRERFPIYNEPDLEERYPKYYASLQADKEN